MKEITPMNRVLAWLADRHRTAATDDRGTIVETVVIAAGLAALAIGTVATITFLVDQKVAGISL
jgi:hypothetical protein